MAVRTEEASDLTRFCKGKNIGVIAVNATGPPPVRLNAHLTPEIRQPRMGLVIMPNMRLTC